MSKVSKGSTGERVDSAEERAGRGVRRAGGAQGRWEGRGVGEVMARALDEVDHVIPVEGGGRGRLPLTVMWEKK